MLTLSFQKYWQKKPKNKLTYFLIFDEWRLR
jgi:hypothetical protein